MGRLFRLVRKELSEILRDRRTIVTLIAMPLLLYPLMSIAFQQYFLASRLDPAGGAVYKIGVRTEKEYEVLREFLRYGEHLMRLQAKMKQGAAKKPDPKPATSESEAGPKVEPVFDPDLAKLLQSGAADLAIRIRNPERFELPLKRDVGLDAEVIYLAGNPSAAGALSYIERRLQAVHNFNLEQRLGLPGLRPVAYMRLARTAVEPEGGSAAISLAALVPLILILMTITGAVYPAIDLTAGERERGTLEILVAAPVPRLGLLFAKYVSVLTIAVLTALINLTTMLLTLSISGLGQMLFNNQPLTPWLILQLFGLLLLFAAFFSAVLLSLTSFARSFKEAQAYLIPLMLASLGPGLVGMMPGVKLEGAMPIVPLLNIVLLARDLFEGQVDPAAAVLVIGSTLAYAAAAIALAARVFGAESVLYNEQSGWSDLFRRPDQSSAHGSVPSALWCMVLMVPAFFFVSQGILRLVGPVPPGIQIVFMGVLPVVLFAGFPLIAAQRGHVTFATGFALLRARPAGYLAAIVLGASLWPPVFKVMEHLNPELNAAVRDHYAALIEQLRINREAFLAGMVIVVVVTALAEELFFRGYLFGALEPTLPPWATIALTGLLFGLMHWVMGGPLGPHRIVPSTLMGLVLGTVRWHTGSVVPAMLLHAVHNVILVTLGREDLTEQREVPWDWVAFGAAGTVAGAALLLLWGRKPNAPRAD